MRYINFPPQKTAKYINFLDVLLEMVTFQDLFNALDKLKIRNKTNFVMLYGSVSKGQDTPLSDVDVCISFNLPLVKRMKCRIKLLGLLSDKYDIQIFEDLPLYVQKEVLQGRVIYCKNEEKLVQVALGTIREYEQFKKIYEYYIASDKSKVEI